MDLRLHNIVVGYQSLSTLRDGWQQWVQAEREGSVVVLAKLLWDIKYDQGGPLDPRPRIVSSLARVTERRTRLGNDDALV
jgi:hypothetical protein